MELLLEVNQMASDLAEHDRRDGDGGYRFTLGAFFYAAATDERMTPGPRIGRAADGTARSRPQKGRPGRSAAGMTMIQPPPFHRRSW